MWSRTRVPWSQIDFSLAGPVQGTTHLSWWIHIQSGQRSYLKICHNRYHYQQPPPGIRHAWRTKGLLSLSKYPPFTLPNLNGLEKQLIDNVKRLLLASQEEDTVEEILNSLQFRYQTTSHVGVQIWVRHRKNPRSCRGIPQLWRPNAIISPTVSPDASKGTRRKLKVEQTSEFMEVLDNNEQ
ncbi:hypothetical protein ACTXT7_015995 [Hymenolepis weldensis]